MGHSRILWKLKPQPKRKKPARYPDCPLCGAGLLPNQKTRQMFINRERVTVHDSC